MSDLNYRGYRLTLEVKKTFAAAVVACSSPGAVMASTSGVLAILEDTRGNYVPKAKIAQWSAQINLDTQEVARLNSVLTDYEPSEIDAELAEELRCILAARKLTKMPELTAADVNQARVAFESGLVPFVRQEVD